MNDNNSNRNLFYIIVAILMSVIAWTYVVYNFDPNIDVKYREVPIEFTGEDVLASRGYGISSASRETIDIVLNQKRVDTGKISEESIVVTADVSDAVEGDNGISLNIVTPDGTQLVETDARSVSVDVEKADSRNVDVIVAYRDAPDIGVEPLVTDLSTDTATIVGPISEVDGVDRVVAYLDYAEVTDNTRNFTRTLEAVDAEGNVLPHMVIYPEEVKFNATAGYTKTVRLTVNVTDKSDDNYERTYTAPETITIKGTNDAISDIDSVSTVEINIGNIYEDTDFDLSYALPDGVEVSNESLGGRLHVTVAEKKEEKKSEED